MTEAQDPDGQISIGELLDAVIEQEASDLHLIAGAPPLMRLHGDLEPMPGFSSLRPETVRALVYSVLDDRQRERLEHDLELDLAHTVPGICRFRVNVYYQRGSLGAAFRTIPYEIKPIGELGLPPAVADLARLQRGLVLVTGPTGAGKSTTLAAMVDIVNNERKAHIMTVEDPIEFLHKHRKSAVSQREVGSDTTDFANALKHVLRQDPDVILVGEMRDMETVATAITAAETGHLVFATLHTQDAPQTIDRIIDVFPSHQQQQIRVQVSTTLQGVVAQQLLPTADRPGRVVAAEVLIVTGAVRNLIRERKVHQVYGAMQAGKKFGMKTMEDSLAELVQTGQVTREVAEQHAHYPDELTRLLGTGIEAVAAS